MKLPIESDPHPKPTPEPDSPIEWPVRRSLRCPPVIPPPPIPFEEVLEARRTWRAMVDAPLREIVNSIAYATRPRFVLKDDEHQRTRRPSPSAGALHPIDVAILDWRVAPRVMRYQPFSHTLQVLALKDRNKASVLTEKIRDVVPFAKGTAVVFLGDVGRVGAFYENPHSLLWRDAGALLQTLLLSATAFRLACCPVGLLGGELVEAIGLEGRLIGTGVAVVGRAFPTNQDITGR